MPTLKSTSFVLSQKSAKSWASQKSPISLYDFAREIELLPLSIFPPLGPGHIACRQNQGISISFINEENNKITPAIRLAHYGINILAGAMFFLNITEMWFIGKDFSHFILAHMMFYYALLSNFIKPDYPLNLQLPALQFKKNQN